MILRLDYMNLPQVERFAAALAPHLAQGDAILLAGSLGSGKTSFARALIQQRLRPQRRDEDVPSPTFTLAQTYFDGICEIFHADLYRLESPSEIPALGLEEALQDSICLIEWPERMGRLLPERALTISFQFINCWPKFRELTIETDCDSLSRRLAEAMRVT